MSPTSDNNLSSSYKYVLIIIVCPNIVVHFRDDLGKLNVCTRSTMFYISLAYNNFVCTF